MKKRILIIMFSGMVLFSLVGCKQSNNNKEKTNDDFIGKWNAIKAVDVKTGEETINLRDVFGSSYGEFGSYLELNEDGTFVDAIVPITDGSKSNTGKYTIERDYYKVGDTYIFLTYSDGNKDTLQRINLDDNGEPYLVLDTFINGYQLYFKK